MVTKKIINLSILTFVLLYKNFSFAMNDSFENNNNIIKNPTETSCDNKSYMQIKEYFKKLCVICQQLDFQEDQYDFEYFKVKKQFRKEIIEKTEDIKPKIIKPPIQYTKGRHASYLPKYASATKNDLYNASKIPLRDTFCIAAQGPYINTFENFFALLGENKSTISVSLVTEKEFQTEFNKKLGFFIEANQDAYKIEAIKDESNNSLIRDEYNVKLVDSYIDDNLDLEYELFLINDTYHLRIYDTNCTDDIDLNKIIAIVIFIKKIKKIDILNLIYSPLVVNCNKGKGRTGAFISLLNIIESHLNNEKIISPDKFILNARCYRSNFVSKAEQYGIIKYLSKNLNKIDNIMAKFIDEVKL